MHLEATTDSRWAVALELLESGQTWIGLADLVLSCDPATDRVRRRLHVEFPCPVDPVYAGSPPSARLGDLANAALNRARELIGTTCDTDPRFRTLVAESDVLYEFAYGQRGLLVATGRPSGALTWRQ